MGSGEDGRIPLFATRYSQAINNETSMTEPVKVGIVGLGRWAKVLTRASQKSDKLAIVAGYSRSEDKRAAFAQETGVAAVPDLATMLADPAILGVILTVPNE